MNRSAPCCFTEEFARSVACWPQIRLDWILSCCTGSDDPECWGYARTPESCCAAFLPQILAKTKLDTLSRDLSESLAVRPADVSDALRWYWSCFDAFPDGLKRDLHESMMTARSALAVTTTSVSPLAGNETGTLPVLKVVVNNLLMYQRTKLVFLHRFSQRHDCVINIFSANCVAEHLPVFSELGMFHGPSNRDEMLDFLGVSTSVDLRCPLGEDSFLELDACHPPSKIHECVGFLDRWGRPLPMLDEEYFEWQDVLEAARLASQRGDHFAMAEVGAGAFGIWAVRAAVAFLRMAPPGATCELLVVEPVHLGDGRAFRRHLEANLPPGRCKVAVL